MRGAQTRMLMPVYVTVAQVNLKVNHCLLALPGVKREDIKRVMSHPQAR